MTESNGSERVYKPSSDPAFAVREEVLGINDEVKKELLKFKDPVVLGFLIYKMKEERENTNRLVKTLLQRIETLESRLQGIETTRTRPRKPSPFLPKIDTRILAFVKKRGKACAEDVQRHFKYKGKNAASARLNKLFEAGFFEKKQAGRTVYYVPTQ